MDRPQIPTEEEQFAAYKKVAETLEGKPVIIRTLDVGGDKEIPYLALEKEENPFLGFRAIRLCLKREDLYRPQLKALLRASAYGDIRNFRKNLRALGIRRALGFLYVVPLGMSGHGYLPFCEFQIKSDSIISLELEFDNPGPTFLVRKVGKRTLCDTTFRLCS